jgi:sugar lactone lactonase YvrE
VGLNDAIHLPLREGENELLLIVAESFGGWGFICQDGEATFQHDAVSKLWETTDDFLIPECVVYDPVRRALYVSNYDAYNFSRTGRAQSISKVSLGGEVQDLDWAGGLSNPTGMAISGDRLLAVERTGVVEIDLESGQVLVRREVPGAMLLNDIAVDGAGRMYVSDSNRSVIYRISGVETEVWLEGDQIARPNGLHVHQGRLLFGNNGDTSLKSVDLSTGEIITVAQLGSGIIDGVETDGAGNYLVSLWEGKVYRIKPSGEITKLLDTTVVGSNCADFEYIVEEGRLVIPTFLSNTITAYDLAESDL